MIAALKTRLQAAIAVLLFLNLAVLLVNFFVEKGCPFAVFLYCGIPLHFFADLLSHRWKEGNLLFLHCFLYTLFFLPLFLWFKLDLWWLSVIFASHVIIDWPAEKFILFLVKFFAKEQHETISFGIDQVFHLLVPFIIALIVF